MAQFVTHIQPTLVEASQGHVPHHHNHQVGLQHQSHLPHSGHNMPSPPTHNHYHNQNIQLQQQNNQFHSKNQNGQHSKFCHDNYTSHSAGDGNTSFLRAARAGNLEKVLEHLKNNIDINTSNNNGLNALHLASKDGHIHVVSELLRRGAIVDSATKKGNTALHIASLAGQEEVVTLLLQSAASVNVQSQNGFTPLYMAAQENHDKVVKLLLANGANQSLATEDGFTPLAVAMQQGHDKVVAVLLESDTRGKVRLPALHIAAKKDDVKAASLLLENDHNPDITSKSGFTPLHIASHYGNQSIANLLLQKGADVNYLAKHNISPLHVAAKWGKTNMVSLLLEKGANIEAKTRDGLTPLHCAARSGHEQVVDMLLERGAPISAKTKNGLAPLHMAAQGEHVDAARILLYHRAPVDEVTVDYLTALHVAAHCGHVRVAKLLLDRSADANARALNGFTPLHIACKKNRIKVVELLLRHGASISATTESGLTPLHVAAFMGCMNIVIYLLQHDASPDVPTVRGETPLHLAARANQTDIIRILLRNGAQVDARAREQQTPLHIASRLGNVDIVMLLLQHGAQVDATTKDMYTALHIAAKEGQDEVCAVLTENGAVLDSATKKGFTPLHLAAKYGHMKVAQLLLQKDAQVDAQGKNGVTPLHVACHYDKQNVALLLLERGANPHSPAKNGHTPLHIAARKNQMDIATTLLEYEAYADTESKAGFTPLHLSSQEGHSELSSLLIEHKANCNHAAKNGLTPMHLCAQEDNVNVAEILKKNGADINTVTKAGYTPLHVASHFGQSNMVRFLLRNSAKIDAATSIGYTPLHQAAQQGHCHIVNLLLEHKANANAQTVNGQTPLHIARKLGYISVLDSLKSITIEGDIELKDQFEDKYRVVAPEAMHEIFMSDSEEEGGEDNVLSDQPYRYLTVDEMKSLGDDSLPIDVTRDERIDSNRIAQVPDNSPKPPAVELSSPHQGKMYAMNKNSIDVTNLKFHDSQEIIQPRRKLQWRNFLVSFLVDARGGAMRGCRHSGVKIIIPSRSTCQPTRITCRYVKPQRTMHPPQLMEGEALASRVLELGPVSLKFQGPVLMEVPHFASLRGKEREIIILRSDNGETWREHSIDNSEELIFDILNECFESDEVNQLNEQTTGHVCRFITYDFPQYFAVVSRVRQEVHAIGSEGGMVSSNVVPQVQAIFPQGALTKKIKVGLQAQPVDPDLTAKLLGRGVAVSPIVTVEPRRRKFHKAITLSMPAPKAHSQGMINQYSGNTPTLRLLCSITGGATRAQWEDVTGSTPLTFVNECVSFTTTVSARFWLMDCRNISEATKMATELYREVIHVPFMAKFVVFAKRVEQNEAKLRVFCMTDDKEDKTLEKQEQFIQVAKSRDVEVLEGKPQFIEMAGNLVPVTKSGDQLQLMFRAFRENRLAFTVRIKDQHADIVGRTLFMKDPRIAKGELPQHPICILNIILPEIVILEQQAETQERKNSDHLPVDFNGSGYVGNLRIVDLSNLLGSDYIKLGLKVGITQFDIDMIVAKHPTSIAQQAQDLIRLLKEREHFNMYVLEDALKEIGRNDILKKCAIAPNNYMNSYVKNTQPIGYKQSTTMEGIHEREEIKYSAEEKEIEESESDDDNQKRTVAERREKIVKRLSIERQIPASSQKKEIVQEITEIKRRSLIEDKKAIHEEEIMLQMPTDNIVITNMPEIVRTKFNKMDAEVSKSNFNKELEFKFKTASKTSDYDDIDEKYKLVSEGDSNKIENTNETIRKSIMSKNESSSGDEIIQMAVAADSYIENHCSELQQHEMDIPTNEVISKESYNSGVGVPFNPSEGKEDQFYEDIKQTIMQKINGNNANIRNEVEAAKEVPHSQTPPPTPIDIKAGQKISDVGISYNGLTLSSLILDNNGLSENDQRPEDINLLEVPNMINNAKKLIELLETPPIVMEKRHLNQYSELALDQNSHYVRDVIDKIENTSLEAIPFQTKSKQTNRTLDLKAIEDQITQESEYQPKAKISAVLVEDNYEDLESISEPVCEIKCLKKNVQKLAKNTSNQIQLNSIKELFPLNCNNSTCIYKFPINLKINTYLSDSKRDTQLSTVKPMYIVPCGHKLGSNGHFQYMTYDKNAFPVTKNERNLKKFPINSSDFIISSKPGESKEYIHSKNKNVILSKISKSVPHTTNLSKLNSTKSISYTLTHKGNDCTHPVIEEHIQPLLIFHENQKLLKKNPIKLPTVHTTGMVNYTRDISNCNEAIENICHNNENLHIGLVDKSGIRLSNSEINMTESKTKLNENNTFEYVTEFETAQDIQISQAPFSQPIAKVDYKSSTATNQCNYRYEQHLLASEITRINRLLEVHESEGVEVIPDYIKKPTDVKTTEITQCPQRSISTLKDDKCLNADSSMYLEIQEKDLKKDILIDSEIGKGLSLEVLTSPVCAPVEKKVADIISILPVTKSNQIELDVKSMQYQTLDGNNMTGKNKLNESEHCYSKLSSLSPINTYGPNGARYSMNKPLSNTSPDHCEINKANVSAKLLKIDSITVNAILDPPENKRLHETTDATEAIKISQEISSPVDDVATPNGGYETVLRIQKMDSSYDSGLRSKLYDETAVSGSEISTKPVCTQVKNVGIMVTNSNQTELAEKDMQQQTFDGNNMIETSIQFDVGHTDAEIYFEKNPENECEYSKVSTVSSTNTDKPCGGIYSLTDTRIPDKSEINKSDVSFKLHKIESTLLIAFPNFPERKCLPEVFVSGSEVSTKPVCAQVRKEVNSDSDITGAADSNQIEQLQENMQKQAHDGNNMIEHPTPFAIGQAYIENYSKFNTLSPPNADGNCGTKHPLVNTRSPDQSELNMNVSYELHNIDSPLTIASSDPSEKKRLREVIDPIETMNIFQNVSSPVEEVAKPNANNKAVLRIQETDSSHDSEIISDFLKEIDVPGSDTSTRPICVQIRKEITNISHITGAADSNQIELLQENMQKKALGGNNMIENPTQSAIGHAHIENYSKFNTLSPPNADGNCGTKHPLVNTRSPDQSELNMNVSYELHNIDSPLKIASSDRSEKKRLREVIDPIETMNIFQNVSSPVEEVAKPNANNKAVLRIQETDSSHDSEIISDFLKEIDVPGSDTSTRPICVQIRKEITNISHITGAADSNQIELLQENMQKQALGGNNKIETPTQSAIGHAHIENYSKFNTLSPTNADGNCGTKYSLVNTRSHDQSELNTNVSYGLHNIDSPLVIAGSDPSEKKRLRGVIDPIETVNIFQNVSSPVEEVAKPNDNSKAVSRIQETDSLHDSEIISDFLKEIDVPGSDTSTRPICVQIRKEITNISHITGAADSNQIELLQENMQKQALGGNNKIETPTQSAIGHAHIENYSKFNTLSPTNADGNCGTKYSLVNTRSPDQSQLNTNVSYGLHNIDSPLVIAGSDPSEKKRLRDVIDPIQAMNIFQNASSPVEEVAKPNANTKAVLRIQETDSSHDSEIISDFLQEIDGSDISTRSVCVQIRKETTNVSHITGAADSNQIELLQENMQKQALGGNNMIENPTQSAIGHVHIENYSKFNTLSPTNADGNCGTKYSLVNTRSPDQSKLSTSVSYELHNINSPLAIARSDPFEKKCLREVIDPTETMNIFQNVSSLVEEVAKPNANSKAVLRIQETDSSHDSEIISDFLKEIDVPGSDTSTRPICVQIRKEITNVSDITGAADSNQIVLLQENMQKQALGGNNMVENLTQSAIGHAHNENYSKFNTLSPTNADGNCGTKYSLVNTRSPDQSELNTNVSYELHNIDSPLVIAGSDPSEKKRLRDAIDPIQTMNIFQNASSPVEEVAKPNANNKAVLRIQETDSSHDSEIISDFLQEIDVPGSDTSVRPICVQIRKEITNISDITGAADSNQIELLQEDMQKQALGGNNMIENPTQSAIGHAHIENYSKFNTLSPTNADGNCGTKYSLVNTRSPDQSELNTNVSYELHSIDSPLAIASSDPSEKKRLRDAIDPIQTMNIFQNASSPVEEVAKPNANNKAVLRIQETDSSHDSEIISDFLQEIDVPGSDTSVRPICVQIRKEITNISDITGAADSNQIELLQEDMQKQALGGNNMIENPTQSAIGHAHIENYSKFNTLSPTNADGNCGTKYSLVNTRSPDQSELNTNVSYELHSIDSPLAIASSDPSEKKRLREVIDPIETMNIFRNVSSPVEEVAKPNSNNKVVPRIENTDSSHDSEIIKDFHNEIAVSASEISRKQFCAQVRNEVNDVPNIIEATTSDQVEEKVPQEMHGCNIMTETPIRFAGGHVDAQITETECNYSKLSKLPQTASVSTCANAYLISKIPTDSRNPHQSELKKNNTFSEFHDSELTLEIAIPDHSEKNRLSAIIDSIEVMQIPRDFCNSVEEVAVFNANLAVGPKIQNLDFKKDLKKGNIYDKSESEISGSELSMSKFEEIHDGEDVVKNTLQFGAEYTDNEINSHNIHEVKCFYSKLNIHQPISTEALCSEEYSIGKTPIGRKNLDPSEKNETNGASELHEKEFISAIAIPDLPEEKFVSAITNTEGVMKVLQDLSSTVEDVVKPYSEAPQKTDNKIDSSYDFLDKTAVSDSDLPTNVACAKVTKVVDDDRLLVTCSKQTKLTLKSLPQKAYDGNNMIENTIQSVFEQVDADSITNAENADLKQNPACASEIKANFDSPSSGPSEKSFCVHDKIQVIDSLTMERVEERVRLKSRDCDSGIEDVFRTGFENFEPENHSSMNNVSECDFLKLNMQPLCIASLVRSNINSPGQTDIRQSGEFLKGWDSELKALNTFPEPMQENLLSGITTSVHSAPDSFKPALDIKKLNAESDLHIQKLWVKPVFLPDSNTEDHETSVQGRDHGVKNPTLKDFDIKDLTNLPIKNMDLKMYSPYDSKEKLDLPKIRKAEPFVSTDTMESVEGGCVRMVNDACTDSCRNLDFKQPPAFIPLSFIETSTRSPQYLEIQEQVEDISFQPRLPLTDKKSATISDQCSNTFPTEENKICCTVTDHFSQANVYLITETQGSQPCPNMLNNTTNILKYNKSRIGDNLSSKSIVIEKVAEGSFQNKKCRKHQNSNVKLEQKITSNRLLKKPVKVTKFETKFREINKQFLPDSTSEDHSIYLSKPSAKNNSKINIDSIEDFEDKRVFSHDLMSVSFCVEFKKESSTVEKRTKNQVPLKEVSSSEFNNSRTTSKLTSKSSVIRAKNAPDPTTLKPITPKKTFFPRLTKENKEFQNTSSTELSKLKDHAYFNSSNIQQTKRTTGHAHNLQGESKSKTNAAFNSIVQPNKSNVTNLQCIDKAKSKKPIQKMQTNSCTKQSYMRSTLSHNLKTITAENDKKCPSLEPNKKSQMELNQLPVKEMVETPGLTKNKIVVTQKTKKRATKSAGTRDVSVIDKNILNRNNSFLKEVSSTTRDTIEMIQNNKSRTITKKYEKLRGQSSAVSNQITEAKRSQCELQKKEKNKNPNIKALGLKTKEANKNIAIAYESSENTNLDHHSTKQNIRQKPKKDIELPKNKKKSHIELQKAENVKMKNLVGRKIVNNNIKSNNSLLPNKQMGGEIKNIRKNMVTSEVFMKSLDSNKSIEVIFKEPSITDIENISLRKNGDQKIQELEPSFIDTTDSSLSDSVALSLYALEHDKLFSLSPGSPIPTKDPLLLIHEEFKSSPSEQFCEQQPEAIKYIKHSLESRNMMTNRIQDIPTKENIPADTSLKDIADDHVNTPSCDAFTMQAIKQEASFLVHKVLEESLTMVNTQQQHTIQNQSEFLTNPEESRASYSIIKNEDGSKIEKQINKITSEIENIDQNIEYFNGAFSTIVHEDEISSLQQDFSKISWNESISATASTLADTEQITSDNDIQDFSTETEEVTQHDLNDELPSKEDILCKELTPIPTPRMLYRDSRLIKDEIENRTEDGQPIPRPRLQQNVDNFTSEDDSYDSNEAATNICESVSNGSLIEGKQLEEKEKTSLSTEPQATQDLNATLNYQEPLIETIDATLTQIQFGQIQCEITDKAQEMFNSKLKTELKYGNGQEEENLCKSNKIDIDNNKHEDIFTHSDQDSVCDALLSAEKSKSDSEKSETQTSFYIGELSSNVIKKSKPYLKDEQTELFDYSSEYENAMDKEIKIETVQDNCRHVELEEHSLQDNKVVRQSSETRNDLLENEIEIQKSFKELIDSNDCAKSSVGDVHTLIALREIPDADISLSSDTRESTRNDTDRNDQESNRVAEKNVSKTTKLDLLLDKSELELSEKCCTIMSADKIHEVASDKYLPDVLLVEKTLEEVQQSLDAAKEELIQVVKDGKSIKQSPSEFEFRHVSYLKTETVPQEDEKSEETQKGFSSGILENISEIPSQLDNNVSSSIISVDDSVQKSADVDYQPTQGLITAKVQRWSLLEAENSSSSESNQKTDPDMHTIYTSSEYQTALDASVCKESTEYVSAISSLDNSGKTISSHESMKSLSSDISANLGSIDASDLSETLVASIEEQDDDIDMEDRELDLVQDNVSPVRTEVFNPIASDDESQLNVMKRSQEMIFTTDEVPERFESNSLNQSLDIEDLPHISHSLESQILASSLEENSILSTSTTSCIDTVIQNFDDLVGSAGSSSLISTGICTSTNEEDTIFQIFDVPDPKVDLQGSHSVDNAQQEEPCRRGHKRMESTCVNNDIIKKILDDPGNLSEDVDVNSTAFIKAVSDDPKGSESESDHDPYESEYSRAFKSPTQRKKRKDKKHPEVLEQNNDSSFTSLHLATQTIIEDTIIEEIESQLTTQDRLPSQNMQDYSNIPNITVTEEFVKSGIESDTFSDSMLYKVKTQDELHKVKDAPIQRTSEVAFSIGDEKFNELMQQQYQQKLADLDKQSESDFKAPDSPDSFEMLNQPDLIDEFVIIEEVAKEANEFDTEGKSIKIKLGKTTELHDQEVEQILIKSAPAATNLGSQMFKDDLSFDFEESPPSVQNKTDTESVEVLANKKWVEMQLSDNSQLRYPYELERGILEDIKEEDAEFEVGSSKISSFKDSYSSTPDYDVLAGRKYFTKNDHDDISMNSLQEFENLEQAISLENRRGHQGSTDSSSGSFTRRIMVRNTCGDDISLSSLKEFEGLENACIEAHLIETKAKEEAALLLSRSDESNKSNSGKEYVNTGAKITTDNSETILKSKLKECEERNLSAMRISQDSLEMEEDIQESKNEILNMSMALDRSVDNIRLMEPLEPLTISQNVTSFLTTLSPNVTNMTTTDTVVIHVSDSISKDISNDSLNLYIEQTSSTATNATYNNESISIMSDSITSCGSSTLIEDPSIPSQSLTQINTEDNNEQL